MSSQKEKKSKLQVLKLLKKAFNESPKPPDVNICATEKHRHRLDYQFEFVDGDAAEEEKSWLLIWSYLAQQQQQSQKLDTVMVEIGNSFAAKSSQRSLF